MKSIIYENASYWNLMWVVLVLAVIVALGVSWRRRALARFVGSTFASLLAPGVSLMRLRIKAWLWVLAMAALLLALVDIRWGKHMVEVQQKGVDVMFVLDVSQSMLAEDVTPSRLMRAEDYICDMLDVMRGDRAGLVAFAGSEKMLVPLTSNYSEIKMALEEAGPHSVARGGTALGDAIRVASNRFLDKTPDYKVILILSDGEDMDSYAVEAASVAHKDKGVKIFTVALGNDKQGARIPLQYTSEGKIYMRYQGKEVWTKMNGKLLEQVAIAGGGAYIPAGTSRLDIADVYNKYIDPMQEREFDQTRVSTYIPRYQWFLSVSVLLFLIEAFMLAKRNGGVKKFFRFSKKAAACAVMGVMFFACGVARADVSPQAAVKQANAELQAGEFDKALKTYEQLKAENPADAQRLIYNQAVARYRKGELQKARDLLKQAAEQGNKSLEAMARYNIGNCFYSEAIAQAKQKKTKEGIEQLDKAVGEYRKSLAAQQADNDARANIELAELLKKQLKDEEKKQQQQQQKQQQQQNKNQQQNQQNQQNKENKQQEQNKNQQQQNQSNKDKQDKNKQDQNQKQQDQNKQQQDKNQQNKNDQNKQNKNEQNKQDQQNKSEQEKNKEKEKQQQDKNEQQKQNQQNQSQQPQQNQPKPGEKNDNRKQQGGGGAAEQPQQAKPKEVSDEQAARVLQGIRDRNLKRRIEKFRKAKAEQAPVDKNW